MRIADVVEMSIYEVVTKLMGYAKASKAYIVDPCRIEYAKRIPMSNQHTRHTIIRIRHRFDNNLASFGQFFQIYRKTQEALVTEESLGLSRQDDPEVFIGSAHHYSSLSL